MNTEHRFALGRWYLVLILIVAGAPAAADVPDAERRARSAVPAADEALLYAYRAADPDPAPVALVLNGRETVQLAPQTFFMWRVAPGQVDVSVEGTASRLTLQPEAGRVYYLEVMRTPSGAMLQTVTFATGRTAIQRARLAAPAGEAGRVAPVARSAPGRRASNGALMLKGGSFKLADDAQTLLGNPFTFDDASSSMYALEVEWFVQPGTSLGIEVMGFSSDYTTVGTGEVDTTAALLNVKRYFRPGGAWQPYAGIGFGGVATDLTGSITGNSSGPAVQVAVGLQWRGARFAARAEYKYLSAETEDDAGETLDVSGGGFFLGLGFYF